MRNRSTSTFALACSTILMVALTACSGGTTGDDEINQFLCTQNDVGPDYIELARGEFTPRDLADLTTDAGEGKERVRIERIESGPVRLLQGGAAETAIRPAA